MNATFLHVPGHWECPLCGFQQIKSILAPGGVYTDTAPHLEPCPNDGRDMVPLTWQRACENQEKVLTQLLDQITAKDEAIADLNQRLIDRTSSFLDLIQAQQLEIARWKRQAMTAHVIIEQAYVHNQNMHCFTTKGRLNDQLNEQTTLLRTFLKP